MKKQFNNSNDDTPTSFNFHSHHLLLWFIGSIDISILKASLHELIRRDEMLRPTFIELNGLPISEHPLLPIHLTVVDHPECEINRRIQTEIAAPFDLDKGPVIRVKLIRLKGEKQVLLLEFHHVISDKGWMDEFARDLLALYGMFSMGQPLPKLYSQAEDIALERERLLTYWKRQLADAPTLHLPTDKPRPQVPSFGMKRQLFSLPPSVAEGLKILSKREGVTLFMTMAAAFQIILHRYSSQDDIVMCTPVAADSRLELENLTGYFINILALRTNISGNPSFRELLSQVCEVILEAYANQDMPFKKLADTLDLKRDPLFQVMFVFQDEPQLNEIISECLQVDTEAVKFDLILKLSETPHSIDGIAEYATDLFEASTIRRLIGHFQTLLEGIIAHPEAHLSKLPMLTETERRQLLVEWNNTAIEVSGTNFIHQLFEEQVERTPHAVAVVYKNQQLTYGELNARANQLAHYLRHIGVEPEALVGICLERSIDQVIGWLSILKAGGAYVPLDPCYPKELLEFMLEDSAPLALLTNDQYEALFADMSKCPRLIDLSTKFPAWAIFPDTNPDHESVGLKPENLAYVIYTSGSTGKPKGAEILHRGLQNLLPWYIRESTNLTCDDTVLVVTSMAFDVTQKVIYGPLLVGARLVLASEPFDPQAIVKLVLQERISMMTITPSGFYTLIDANTNGELSNLRRVFLGGEPMQPSKLLEMPEPRPEFFNNYGPTECTAIATSFRMSADLEQYLNRSVPIGRPIWNVRIYILDPYQQPVPIGVTGEIYIGGVAVGRGYLNRPELTAERFVLDPFVPETSAHMYKTGDLARWLTDGTIEFLFRNDSQVKIRGFRIELNDIEAALLQHPQLREVVVDVYEAVPADKRLVAYVVSRNNAMITPTEIRDFLKLKLPEFMVPSAYVLLNALPLTPNGKLNRKALPLPLAEEASKECSAPCNEIERKLIVIWKNLLGVKNIAIHDNFFELGGHSLLAVKMTIEISKQFNFDIPLGALYQSPTIKELGITISSGNQQSSSYSLVPIQTQGARPPLFAIHTISLHDLPRYLGKDQPLYFLRYGMAAECSNRSVRLPLLEELASHYINEIQQLQPRGPYYLIGFSFGGVIAYEMANQLVANGHQVNFVGLLDSRLDNQKRSLKIHKLFKPNTTQLLERIKNKINDRAIADKYGADFWPHFYTSVPDKACRNGYQPKKYNGRVTLFQGIQCDDSFFSYAPPEVAWRKLLGDNLEVQEVSGSHLDMCIEPHVKILAEKLIACMDLAINSREYPIRANLRHSKPNDTNCSTT
ncbi:non-ribosomal peptide synthetase [Methylobacter sp.]|uniref:non-ribosomal peptide synthetase n=1 Tax=Methylobacter sp. TaxID=2051955 RepID=UPI002FDD7A46